MLGIINGLLDESACIASRWDQVKGKPDKLRGFIVRSRNG
jgi:hypothetical protein